MTTDEQPLSGKTDRSGVWNQSDILGGHYRLTATVSQGPAVVAETEVRVGETSKVQSVVP